MVHDVELKMTMKLRCPSVVNSARVKEDVNLNDSGLIPKIISVIGRVMLIELVMMIR